MIVKGVEESGLRNTIGKVLPKYTLSGERMGVPEMGISGGF